MNTNKIKYGDWLVIEELPRKNKRRYLLCECKCGTRKAVRFDGLSNGTSKKCHKCANTRHGKSKSVEYKTWDSMRDRCTNINNPNYHNYGGRGIKVCKRWDSFINFYKDMGDKPDGLTLERIDNNAGYSKRNCKWATVQKQSQNRRNTKLSVDTVSDIRKSNCSQSTLAKKYNINQSTVSYIKNFKIWTL